MNELKKIAFPINYNFDWEYSISIAKIREDLDAMEKLGANWIDMESKVYHGDPEIEFKAFNERLETKPEQIERLTIEQARVDANKNRELAQLKALKEKYE